MAPSDGDELNGFGRQDSIDAVHEFTEVDAGVIDLSTIMPVDPFADRALCSETCCWLRRDRLRDPLS